MLLLNFIEELRNISDIIGLELKNGCVLIEIEMEGSKQGTGTGKDRNVSSEKRARQLE